MANQLPSPPVVIDISAALLKIDQQSYLKALDKVDDLVVIRWARKKFGRRSAAKRFLINIGWMDEA